MKPDHLKVNLEMKLAFISLLVLLAGCAADKQNTGLKWASPGNVYSAYLQEAPGDTGSQSLNLVVESRDKHAILFSLPLQRHAKVVWSQHGDQVAIIDDFASNENRIEIFSLPSGRKFLTISRDNWYNLNKDLPSPTNYSHVYFSDLVWTEPQKVKLKVEMYDRLSLTVPEEYAGNCQFDVTDNQ
jgi:hypothetical protein